MDTYTQPTLKYSDTLSQSTSIGSSAKTGQGWQTFLNVLPGLFSAIGDTAVGIKNANTARDIAQTQQGGWMNNFGFGQQQGVNNNAGGGMIIWVIIGLVVVVGAFFLMRKK